jgi:hypothetical protein
MIRALISSGGNRARPVAMHSNFSIDITAGPERHCLAIAGRDKPIGTFKHTLSYFLALGIHERVCLAPSLICGPTISAAAVRHGAAAVPAWHDTSDSTCCTRGARYTAKHCTINLMTLEWRSYRRWWLQHRAQCCPKRAAPAAGPRVTRPPGVPRHVQQSVSRSPGVLHHCIDHR